MRRFWKDVAVVSEAGGYGLALDGKPVRTPGRAPLVAPTRALAEAIADEWRGVGDTLDPRAMPLTGLANAAIDRIAPAPAGFAAGLSAYAASDLLCYRADAPPPLVERQRAEWDPLLDWARTRYDIHFELAEGVMPTPQPPATLARIAEAVSALDAWRLAGLSPVVTVSGSVIAGLALLEGAATADQVWAAGELDEQWQAEQWGEDPLAIPSREVRHRDLSAGAQLLALLDQEGAAG